MPMYTVIIQEGSVSGEAKAKIAEEITRIHTALMKVPRNFVRVVFLSYSSGSGFAAGDQAPTAALIGILRSGHPTDVKSELLKQLWSMFQAETHIATDLLAVSLQEVPASDAMEFGQVMHGVG